MKTSQAFKKSFLFLILLITCLNTISVKADDDDEEGEKKGKVSRINSRSSIPSVINQKWKTECASCHMLYLPGLLPARSWTKMMGNLKKHFGENAELDLGTQKEISDFLFANSSDKIHSSRGDKILSGIGTNEEVLRISETQYFKRKHDEINASVYKRKAIGSPANCLACHSGAEKGDFSEDNVRIPKDSAVKFNIKK